MKRRERRKAFLGRNDASGEAQDDDRHRSSRDNQTGKIQGNSYCRVESPLTVNVAPEIYKQHQREREEDEDQHKKQLFWTKVAAALVFLYTIAAFGGVIYSALIYRSSVKASEKQLRAYVVISNIQLIVPKTPSATGDLQPGDNTFRFISKNDGQTPVRHLQLTLSREPWITGGVNTTIPGPASPKSSVVLGPGDTSFNDETLYNLSAATIDDLHSGVAHLRIRGVLTYRDIFGSEHHTWWCFQWVGGTTRMQACAAGNDFD